MRWIILFGACNRDQENRTPLSLKRGATRVVTKMSAKGNFSVCSTRMSLSRLKDWIASKLTVGKERCNGPKVAKRCNVAVSSVESYL